MHHSPAVKDTVTRVVTGPPEVGVEDNIPVIPALTGEVGRQ